MPAKRDNAYYLDRLKRESPAIHADLQAGKIKSVAEALRIAGIRKSRSAVDDLHSAWKKATSTEKAAFKAFIGCQMATPTLGAPTPAPTVAGKAITATQHVSSAPKVAKPGQKALSLQLKQAITDIMQQRKLRIGDIMREIGEKPLNAALGGALSRDWHPKEAMVTKLEAWVHQHQIKP